MIPDIIQIVKPFSDFSQILRFAQKWSVGFMFYDKFKELCTARSISVSKAATDIGLSNSTPTKWKNTNATPDSTTLAKIADYFGVTVDYLLGTEKEKAPTSEDERIAYASGLSDIYFSLAKDLQDAKIDPDDIRNLANIIAKNMKKADEEHD